MPLRVLLDTNIVIPAEDPQVMPADISRAFEQLQQRGCEIWVHEASKDDLGRDANQSRRDISLSKLSKYRQIPKTLITTVELASKYGSISSENDECDCHMLHAVATELADILVTNDTKLFRRAARIGRAESVLSPRQLLDFLEERYAEEKFSFRYLSELSCAQLNFDDPIFQSFGGDYSDFELWKKKISREGRQCWVVRDGAVLAGIVIFKTETADETDVKLPGQKILKLSTFKVSEDHRGGRLGELLLRQAMWYAHVNKFDSVYVTAFEKQRSLIDLLEEFGFAQSGQNSRGELVLAKSWLAHAQVADKCTQHMKAYPELDFGDEFLIVPIQSRYYQRLFPESKRAARGVTGDLFSDNWSKDASSYLAVATSIRKVYICNSRMQGVSRGDVALFYFSQDEKLDLSQCIAAVGVIERVERYTDANKLIGDTAKRTVYTPKELTEIVDRGGAMALFFVFSGYVRPKTTLDALVDGGILAGHPQSLMRLDGKEAEKLKSIISLAQTPSDD